MKISYDKLVDKGILYILLIKLEDKELVKIGITSRPIQERVCEILTSIWVRYRIFPETYVKKYKEVSNYKHKEVLMHDKFKDYRYTTEHKFSGCTELFDVALEDVVKAYEEINADKDKKDT